MPTTSEQNESKSFDFISGLTESRMIRSLSAMRHLDGRDIADFTFLYLLSLEILRHENVGVASQYAAQTLRAQNFNTFFGAANDLYVLLHVLVGANNQAARKNLGDQPASDALLQTLMVRPLSVKNYLRSIALGQYQPAKSRQFFLEIEGHLKISTSNYRSVRRLVVNWPTLGQRDKELAMTRLLQAFRVRMPRAEIRGTLEGVAKAKKLEIKNVANPETGQQALVQQSSVTPLEIVGALAAGMAAGTVWHMASKKKE